MAYLTIRFFSEALGKCQTVEVIFPQKTYGQIGMTGTGGEQSCKVLYLLHGQSDDQTIWMRRTSIERYAAKYNLAVVMPNGDLSYYTDMKSGPKYYTYIAKELPELIHYFFPQISKKKEDTFIAGLSMGGYGAFKIALRNPERYGGAVSLSGVLDIVAHVKRGGCENPFWYNIFGTWEELEGSENDLFAVARKMDQTLCPRMYAYIGKEDSLYQDNLHASEVWKSLGMNVPLVEASGSHSWEFWDFWIQDGLEKLMNK